MDENKHTPKTMTAEEMMGRIVTLEDQVKALSECVATLLKIQGSAVTSEVRGFHNKIKRLEDEGAQLATANEALLDIFVVKST